MEIDVRKNYCLLINFRDNCRDSLINFFFLCLNKIYYIQDNLYKF